MDPLVFAAIVGAIIGGVFVGLGAVITWALQERSTARRSVRDARISLAREIIRFRGDQKRVVGPLNELPVLFADDDDVLRLYRRMVDGTDTTGTLSDIVARMASVAGATKLAASDVLRFLEVPQPSPVHPSRAADLH